MKIFKGIHHLSIAVSEKEIYDRTIAFYRDVLGCSFVRSWGKDPRHITMLDAGNCIIELVLGGEGSGGGCLSHVALEVATPEEVDTVMQRCLEAGCVLTRSVVDVEPVEDSGHTFRLRFGFCTGLAGEQIEICCLNG